MVGQHLYSLEQDFPSLVPKEAKLDECVTKKCVTNSDKLNNPPEWFAGYSNRFLYYYLLLEITESNKAGGD